MTAFALRLCFADPARDAADYGGERVTFVLEADDVTDALDRWLHRATEKGATLHVVEEARAVEEGALSDLVAAAREGGIAAGASYGYPPLDPPRGVFFGLAEIDGAVTEVAAKAADAGAAVRAVLAACAEERRALTSLEGFCDLSQATEEATFDGTALTVAALGLGMSAAGTVQFGAAYEGDESDG
ncbi:MAG: hypothetical protein AAGP08_07910 [Pseudomonadota bacterium]